MGSGIPPRSISKRARRDGATHGDGSIIRCDVEGTIDARALVNLNERIAGHLLFADGDVVLVAAERRIAVLQTGPLTKRLAVCLRRGHRYQAVARTREGRVVVDVRPDERT